MFFPKRYRLLLCVPIILCLTVWYSWGLKGLPIRLGSNISKDGQTSVVDQAVGGGFGWSGAIETYFKKTTATSPYDVLLLIKTGASTFWRRMPMHLTTTLSNDIPNMMIFSDLEETLAKDVRSIDSLANVSDLIRKFDTAAYDSYLDFQSQRHISTYREHARLPADEPPDAKAGSTPGWLLDKYKFLPMLAHAYRTWPKLQWYIYIEDDTYIFWDSLLQWLSLIPQTNESLYYGALSGEGNETFAQGGSGLIFSKSLMDTVFGGSNPPDLNKYGEYTSKSCCGDVVLGKILRDYDIYVNRGKFGPVSFRPEPPWKTGFEEFFWCSPAFTFHHLHQRDLVQLFELERAQKAATPTRPVIFRDVFISLILPHLVNDTQYHWDNLASRFTLTQNFTTGFHPTFRPVNQTAFDLAYQAPTACQAACASFEDCLSWRHETATESCALDAAIKLGRELDPLPTWAPKTEVVSGWMLERMESTLLTETCEVIKQPDFL